MFGVVKTIYIELLSVCAIGSLRESLLSNLKCVSLNNQPCKAKPAIVNINSDRTLFYPFAVSAYKCGGSSNTLDDLYAQGFCSKQSKKYECKSI